MNGASSGPGIRAILPDGDVPWIVGADEAFASPDAAGTLRRTSIARTWGAAPAPDPDPGYGHARWEGEAMGEPVPLTPRDFDGLTLRRPGRVVALFAAPWCPYCRAFRAKYVKLDPPSGVLLAEVPMDDYEEPLPLRFDIEVIPTVIAFEDGKVAWRHKGIAGVGLGEPTLLKIQRWTG